MQAQETINLAGGREFKAINADEAIVMETNQEVAALKSDLEATAEAMRDIQQLAQQQGVQLQSVYEQTEAAGAQVQEGVDVLDDIPCCGCCACWKCLCRMCGCCKKSTHASQQNKE